MAEGHCTWRICPMCGCDIKHIGSVGIVQADHEWDAQADRFDCPEGHTFLVVETARLDTFDADINPGGR